MKIKQIAAAVSMAAAIALTVPSVAAQAETNPVPGRQNVMNIYCRPSGMMATGDGSILVTDLYNKVIWASRDGVSAVFAGKYEIAPLTAPSHIPAGGYLDTVSDQALMKEPWAIAPFLGGYAVTDSENNVVRLAGGGAVRTAVGAKEAGYLDARGTKARFSNPTGLAADGKGNLYVADTNNNVIRKVDAKGNVTTAVKGLSEPTGLCWKDDALYIADSGNNRIVRAVEGKLTVLAGSGVPGLTDGPAGQAAFNSPQGLAVGSDGTVYIADTGNGAIRRLSQGTVSTVLAASENIEDILYPVRPRGILVSGNTLYVCDTFAACVFTVPLP